jgi:hypothetical protein
MKIETINFEVRGKSFQRGWYTCEIFGHKKIPTYCLVYEDVERNYRKINTSGLMLELFNELPANATINAHK